MAEFLIIMEKGATKEQTERVIKAVWSNKGKVQLRYPPRIIIGREGEDIKNKLTKPKLDGVSAVYLSDTDPEELRLDEVDALDLGRVSSSSVRAWIIRNSKEYRESKAARRIQGLPLKCLDAVALGETPAMKGTAAVGIIIVKGPRESGFRPDEEQKIFNETQNGSEQLTQLAPVAAKLLFVPDIHIVTLSDSPDTIESEKDWRDKAMVQLNNDISYANGSLPSVDSYLDYLLKKDNGSDWAYIAFFTKYKTSFNNMPFYHQRDASYCVLRYPQPGDNGKFMDYTGHPPEELDILFAHETGHLCGAQDENDVPCLMSSDMDWHICPKTASSFQW